MEKKMDQNHSPDVEEDMTNQLIPAKRPKGGLITMPFIIVNEALEKVATYGLLPNMILYLMKDYHVGLAKGASIIFLWSAAINFMPLIGAFLSDSYLGRFLTIGFGSIASFMGMTLLWLTAMVPRSRPSSCDILTQICKSPASSQMAILVLSFALMAIGAGGIRPCSLAFGADQVDKRDNPKNQRVLERFFNWYYASAAVSVIIALTAIVYIQEKLGWKLGFGVPALLMLFATVLFFLASSLYVKHKASKSLFTGFAQVVVVAYKNRKLSFPSGNSHNLYHHKKDSEDVAPTDKLRCLNKACIIRNHEQDIAPDGSASNPWNLCTVEQVEELKALVKVIPIWSTGIMMSINVSQSTFQLLQAKSMDRHLGSFQVPAASFAMFVVISLALWVVIYDRVILPLGLKIRGKSVRIDVKTRMGIGLIFSFLAMVVSAVVENVRRRRVIREGFLNNPHAVVGMSAMWLIPQHCLNGLAEAFNGIGQTEFYYSEFPKSMSSIASALFGLGMAVASLLASVVLSAVDNATSRKGKESWVSDNINRGHYDYYYWLLAIMSFVNLFYYLFCSWAYGPCAEQMKKVTDEPNGTREEEMSKVGRMLRDEGKEERKDQLPI
ncbi:putative peptide transporter [Morus notabilis]|uniref:Putative peptide transporter n=1 Tax=Morus notabilis TaxID=981085 RepID=W9R6J1_9ROSA|nr:protein NRT1/ PTR FAMILY 1.2 [Morus notabilis]EXB74532.1 putative peptide transporter [Morus notabilis]